jgi:glycosyltransferase involved in cell wall biosynthesis
VVLVVRNASGQLGSLLKTASAVASKLVGDYELILIDNGSEDETVTVLKDLAGPSGIPNLQVFTLTSQVDNDSASWAGVENAIGDYVMVVDPLLDDINFAPMLLNQAAKGADVVFAKNQKQILQSYFYRLLSRAFNVLYKALNGVDLSQDAPPFRLMSRKVVNFILQNPQPHVAYRHLPATAGFSRSNLSYSSEPSGEGKKRIQESVARGVTLIVSTSNAPMRIATIASLAAAAVNVLYSIYVVAIGLQDSNLAPGWASLSLQQSSMYFTFALVLYIFGEYLLRVLNLSNSGPAFSIGQEFTSIKINARDKLNITEADSSTAIGHGHGHGTADKRD